MSNVDHDTDNQPGEFVDTPENEPGQQDEPPQSGSSAEPR
jgi:hypothetical protein